MSDPSCRELIDLAEYADQEQIVLVACCKKISGRWDACRTKLAQGLLDVSLSQLEFYPRM